MIYRLHLKAHFEGAPSRAEIRERIARALAREETIIKTQVSDCTDAPSAFNGYNRERWDDVRSLGFPAFNDD